MESIALSQRQIEALNRLLVPRGVDPDDERALLRLAVSMSSHMNNSIPPSDTTDYTAFSPRDAARVAVSRCFLNALLSSPVTSLSKGIAPQFQAAFAVQSDADCNNSFLDFYFDALSRTKVMSTPVSALSMDGTAAAIIILKLTANTIPPSDHSRIKARWSPFILSALQINIPARDTAILRMARLLDDVDCNVDPSPHTSTVLLLLLRVAERLKLVDRDWIDALCVAIAIAPEGSIFKSCAVRLLSGVIGSVEEQVVVYHSFVLDLLVGTTRNLIGSTSDHLSFVCQVKLFSCISAIIRIATNGSPSWLRYMSEHPETQLFFLDCLASESVDLQSLLLSLLAIKLDGKFYFHLREKHVSCLIDILMFAPIVKMREEASFVLQNSDQAFCIPFMNARLGQLPLLGFRGFQFAMLWAKLISENVKEFNVNDYQTAVVEFVHLAADCEKSLSQHPNGSIYQSIGKILSLSDEETFPSTSPTTTSTAVPEKFGYYLASEPCSICCDKRRNHELLKIREIEVEARFTHCSRMIRLQSMKSVKSVHIRLDDLSTIRSVKTVRLYFSAEKVDSLAPLKDKWDRWTLSCTVKSSPWSNEIVLTPGAEFCAYNILIEFVDFYESTDGRVEIIQCPRCRSSVTSKHGICSQCKENAFQCRQCRNINYEHLDAFLCNECGFCRFAQLQLSVSARSAFLMSPIYTEAQRRHALDVVLSTHAGELQIAIDDIMSQRVEIVSLISSDSMSYGRLSRIYRETRTTFRTVCSHYSVVVAVRRELIRYLKRIQQPVPILQTAPPSYCSSTISCFVCLRAFVQLTGPVLHTLSTSPSIQPILVSANILPDLLHKAAWADNPSERDRAKSILSRLSETTPESEKSLHEYLESRLKLLIENVSEVQPSLGLSSYVSILLGVCSLDMAHHELWSLRVQLLFRLFYFAVDVGHTSALVAQHVIIPCLDFLIRLICRIELQNVPVHQSKHRHFSSLSPVSSTRGRVVPFQKKSSRRNGSSVNDSAAVVAARSYVTSLLSASFSQELRLVRNLFLRRRPRLLRSSTLSQLSNASWLKYLLMNPASLDVRTKTIDLVRQLFDRSSDARAAIVPALLKLLATCPLDATSLQFFKLIDEVARREDCKALISRPHVLDLLIALLQRQVILLENGKIETARTLSGVVSLLHQFTVGDLAPRLRLQSEAASFVDAYLCLQGLLLLRTKLIQDTSTMLLKIMDDIFSESDGDRSALIRIYVDGLRRRSQSDVQTSIRILEQIDHVVNPTLDSHHCQLLLRKAPSQEEFIRGNMRKSAYSSVDLVTMGDIKDKICRDLDLQDAGGMFELLVNGCIIDLSLPVIGVYNKIWRPALLSGATSIVDYDSDYEDLVLDSSSMIVTYRLKGLDGEATEDIITQLSNEEQVEPHVKYSVLSMMGEWGGISEFLSQLDNLGSVVEDDIRARYASFLIRILRYCSYLESNRESLTPGYHLLLSCLLAILKVPRDTRDLEGMAGDLLSILVTIVDGNITVAEDDIHKIAQFLLQHDPLPAIWPRLAGLLPWLTGGLLHRSNVLLQCFTSCLDWASIDQGLTPLFPAECFAIISESLMECPPNIALGLRMSCTDTIVPQAFAYLLSIASDGDVASKPALPFVLRILSGLVKGYGPSQIKSMEVIPMLHKLERVSSVNKVGPLAENLLESLCEGCTTTVNTVKSLRCATRDLRKQVALNKRKKLMEELGLQPCAVSSVSIHGMESVTSDPGLTCMVCQEGYAYKPREMLGFYVFGRETHLQSSPGSRDAEIGLTSVTHFNTIHFMCHSEAARADRRLKPPKTEWEGATLRNAHTLCNNLFPILHKSNSLDEYALRVEDYWRNIPFRAAFHLPKLDILLHDLRLLLCCFSQGKSFSEFSRGGGRQSNIKFIPYFLQMSAFLLSNSSSDVKSRLRESVMQLFSERQDRWSLNLSSETGLAAQPHAMEFAVVCTLIVLRPKEWLQYRSLCLRRLIFNARQYCDKSVPPSKRRRVSSKNAALVLDEASIISHVRDTLILYIFVDHLHALLTAFDTNAEPNEAGSPWDRVQRYIRFHHDEMLQDLERFCTVLTDKYLACTSFESLFEVCEGWRNSTSKEETPLGMISSLWSLADNLATKPS